MRRSRISVKPNFRPGGRGVAAGDQASRAPADADNSLHPVAADDAVGPSPSPQEIPPVEKPAVAAGFENAPNSPAQKASADLSNGAPSSGTTTPAAVLQRRMRISATPKLSGPKATSTPRQSAVMSRSTLSALPNKPPVQIPDSVLEISTSGSTAPVEVAKQASKTHEPPSPCKPSTSRPLKSPVHEKKSSRDSPPSPQPGKVPQQPPHEPEPLTATPTSASGMPSAQVKLSCLEPGSPQKGTGMSLDREKILRALKLKELMKIERRKDIKKGQRGVRRKSEYTPSDRNKMTMRDLIYYLPDTSPMRGSTVNEEDQDETIVPLSPKMPEKTPERKEEEDDDDDDDESEEDEDMLVPKVRVAEDGSIILDEESLTVRVQRASKTKVVESTALYERGSASTYSSYRNINHVKPWSVRETDMFFLAISMVGTDFSLIGQLLPHRNRTEIKNKFKKEEKTNSWRIDKAFRNKRPYDREFFSFLLEKVLAKDKEKGKSVRLVLTNPKRRGKARGKKAKDDEEKCLRGSGADEDLDIEDDGGCVDAEKENEGLPNVNKAEKKRKRTSEVKAKEDSCEEQGNRKKRKQAKKTKTEMHVPEGDVEGECGLFNADCDPVNGNKEDEHGPSIPAPKKKRRCSKKAEDNNKVFVEGSKGKQHRKSLKVGKNPEDSIGGNEENAIVVEEDTGAAIKKRKRSRECDPKGSKQTKETKSTKKKRSRRKKGIVEDEGTAEDEEASATAEAEEASATAEDEEASATAEVGEASATAEVGEASATAEVGEASATAEVGEASEAKTIDTPNPAELIGKGSRRSAKKPKRAVPNLTMKRQKKTSEPETTDDRIQENQDENNTTSTLEEGIIYSETEQVQEQAVIVLERTPPRVKSPLSPFEVQQESSESLSSMNLPVSPAVSESSSGQKMRMQRAERVKRSLTAKKKKGKTKAPFNQDDTEHDPETSKEDIKSPTVLLEQMVNQESEDIEAGNSLGEDLIDLSCFDHLNSQTFQRRPMVVLSREEVDMVLNVQDETSEEDPSVSPLDLSLNTELSFQLQCNNILTENTEADRVETDENGDGPQDLSSNIALEKHFEDIGLNESVLGQFISTPTNVSSLKSSVGSSQSSEAATSSSVRRPEPQINSSTDKYMTTTANEPEVSPPLAPETTSEHPVYTKSDAPVTDEAVILFPDVVAHDALLASRGVVEDSKTSLPEIGESSQWPLLKSPEVMVRSLGSVTATPENKGRMQESILATQEIKEGSQGSTVPTPEIKEASPAIIEGMQGSVLATLEIKEGSKGFVVTKPEIKVVSHGSILTTLELKKGPEGCTLTVPPVKEYSQGKDLPGSLLSPSEIVKRSKNTVVATPEIKESSQGSLVGAPEIKDRPESSVVATPLAKEYSQEKDLLGSVLAPLILERSKKSVVISPEIKESSQGSIVGTPVLKDGKEGSVVAAPLDKEFSQEEDLSGSLLTPSEDVERSKKSVVLIPEIKESSQGSIVGTPLIKDGKEGSVLVGQLAKEYSQEEDLPGSVPAPSGILERSKTSVVISPEIRKSSQGSIVGTSEIKDRPESSLVTAPLAKEYSQEEDSLGSMLAPSDILERSKKPVVVIPEIKESSQGSIVGTPVIKDGKEGSVLVGQLAKEYSQEEDSLGSMLAPSDILERSKKPVVVTPEIKESSQGHIVGNPEIKDIPETSVLVAAPLAKEDSQKEEFLGSMLASSAVVERSKTPVVITPDIKESSQGSIVGTPVIKDRKEGSVLVGQLAKEYSQEEDLPGSVPAPSGILERSKTSVVITPEISETSQGSIVGTSEIKDGPESSLVTAPLAKKNSQEEANQTVIPSSTKLSSGASVSFEHGLTLKRRSRFLKPKPNLSGASKIKNAEPRKISSEKIIPKSTDEDQHCEDSSMERFCRDEEKSCAVDLKFESLNSSLIFGLTPPAEVSVEYSEKQAANVASCVSPVLPEQERIISVTPSAASTEESRLASEQTSNTYDVDVISSCASVSEDLQMVNAPCSWPPTTQTAEQERIGHINFEEICAPARIIQPAGGELISTLQKSEDGNSEEEPTFVLTLYEIPVTDVHLPSASNETVVASPFLISDQPPLPSVSDCPSDSLSMETGDVQDSVDISLIESSGTFGKEESDGRVLTLEEKTVPVPSGEHDQKTLAQSKSLHSITQAKDVVSLNLQFTESESVCKDGPEALILEDLKPRDQSTPFTFKVSKCVASMPQDSEDAEQCEGVSHMVLADIFVPVSETGDDLSKDSTLCEELTKEEYSTAESKPLFTDTQESKNTQSLSEEKKAPARRRGKLQPKLVHRASSKKDPSNTSSQAVLPTSQQSIVLQATRAVSKKQEMEDILEAPKLQIIPKAKERSVLDPDLQQKHQTPCTVTLSRCAGSVHQDSCVVAASEGHVDVCMESAAPEEKAAGIPGLKNTSSMTPTSSQEVKMPSRRAKIQVKPTLRKRTATKNLRAQVPQCNLEATESDSSHTTSLGSQEPELEREDTEISTTHITGDDTIKCEMVSSSEDKESSSVAHEEANLQPSHESNLFSEIMGASCSDFSPVDLDEDKEDHEGVSHMVLTDIFVPVSDEMGDDVSQDFFTPIENCPHKEEVSPPLKQEVYLEKIRKKEKPEKSKKSERPTKEKESKQQVKRTCTKKLSNSSCQELETVRVLGCPEVEPAAEAKCSSDLVNLEDKLKQRHQIMPCTVQVSRCTDVPAVEKESEDVSRGVLTDTIVPVSEEVGDDVRKDCMKDKKAISSPLFTPSKGSKKQPVLKIIKSEESPAMMQKKCPSRKKGKLLMKCPFPKRAVKKTEASKTDPPVSEDKAVNLPHTVSQTRQLPITAWAKKKPVQSGSKLEAENLSNTSQSEQSLKDSSSLVPTANEDSESAGQTSTRSTPPSTSSGETEKSHADVSHITSVPPSQDPGEVESEADSSTVKESKEEASLWQMNKSFARRGAKPSVKPRLSKRTRAKEDDNSKNDKPLSSRLTSPTRRSAEAARVKKEPEQLPKEQIAVSNTSRVETNTECEESSVPASVPQSPRHSAAWPRIILPRVKVQTTETGSCFDSSRPTSSPVRVSTSTSQLMIAPQSKSPVVTSNQSDSPKSSEDTEDEPTRVSQFFISDIFTEIEDGD